MPAIMRRPRRAASSFGGGQGAENRTACAILDEAGRGPISLPCRPTPEQDRPAPLNFLPTPPEIADIRELAATGLLDGVTTNPSLIAKSGREFKEVIAEICSIVEGPVSAETTALDA